MTQRTILLMDGDVIAFRAASSVQSTLIDDNGFCRPYANVMEGETAVDNLVFGLKRSLEADAVQMYLSDSESNWRKHLYPDYKENRKDPTKVHRPLLLANLKSYLRSKYGAVHWPHLEADDVLGIVATSPDVVNSEDRYIVVGRDKDFACIPGLHHQMGDVDSRGKPKVVERTLDYANYWHLCQSLAGDQVDNYPGCPGVGIKRAQEYLAEPKVHIKGEGIVTRGKNKGRATVRWTEQDTTDLWACVVSHYRKAGVEDPEGTALLNARLAWIMRYGDYNADTGDVRLWVPERLVEVTNV